MRHFPPCFALLATLGMATAAGGAAAAGGQAAKPSLEELIKQFHGDAPQRVAEVRIEAWIEAGTGDSEPNQLVITIEPDGETRLNADPGITVTPADQPGLSWQLDLPHRHQDFSITYFDPPATISMPFTGRVGQPVEVLVEYAYCFVDYQCFFGEETLHVDMVPGGTG